MKKATILTDTVVFETPRKSEKVLTNLEKGSYVDYNREKYKNGIVWLEVVLKGNETGFMESKNAFKWEENKILGNSITFYPDDLKNEEKTYVILPGKEKVQKILPAEKDEKKNMISKVIDSKNRLGTVNDKYILKIGADFVLKILAILCAVALTIAAAIYAVVFMIMGGKIFYGSLVIAAFVFLGKVIFLIIYAAFDFIRKSIYRVTISF